MEKREHLNQLPGQSGKMAVYFDVASGCAQSYCSGFWSTEQAENYFSDWRAIVQRIHAAGQAVSSLVDLSEAAVQRANVAAIVASGTRGIYRSGDSVALLVPSSLTKMQMRRVIELGCHEFFLSRNAAETWLKGRAITHRQDRLRLERAA